MADQKTLERQRAEYGTLTNAELAEDIGTQIRYIASALGVLGAFEGTFSLSRACRGEAIKSDLWEILDLLRRIKNETRATITKRG